MGAQIMRPFFFVDHSEENLLTLGIIGARMSTNSRIPLFDRDAAGPEAAAIYDALLEQRGVVQNMLKVLSYSPPIAQGVAGFLKALLSDGALTGWYKELVAVRISRLMVSGYAITAHNISARKKGASEPQIAGVADYE